jgi:hypothetical protein
MLSHKNTVHIVKTKANFIKYIKQRAKEVNW